MSEALCKQQKEKNIKLFRVINYPKNKVGKVGTVDDTLATAVPEPIAIPISAFFRAGASLTPSPVIAT
jgi:hypothetical protein